MAALRPLDVVLAAVPRRVDGKVYRGQHLVPCPAHADKHPSLAVRETADGRVLIHCHAGCRVDDVLDALDLDMADLYPDAD